MNGVSRTVELPKSPTQGRCDPRNVNKTPVLNRSSPKGLPILPRTPNPKAQHLNQKDSMPQTGETIVCNHHHNNMNSNNKSHDERNSSDRMQMKYNESQKVGT